MFCRRQVWGLSYIDELVQIGINQDPENAYDAETQGNEENNCERFFWVLQDAHYNVMAVISSSGRIVERYEYTPGSLPAAAG